MIFPGSLEEAEGKLGEADALCSARSWPFAAGRGQHSENDVERGYERSTLGPYPADIHHG